MTKEELREKANDLPLLPGVYLMMDKTGKVIYVGKAKKLKNRVSQYFQDTASHNEKTRAMVSQVDHFDTIFVSSEFEALILENSLIKRHQPRYNILLKDDKGYPFIRLDTGASYPRFTLAGKAEEDGARYFGPFGGRRETRLAIEAVCGALKLPICSRQFPRDIGRERPCLNHHIGRCDGFCLPGGPDQAEYRRRIRQAERIFSGHYRQLTAELQTEMEDAAEELNFEKAAALRDRIRAISVLGKQQQVIAGVCADTDVWGVYVGQVRSGCAVLHIEDGNLLGREVEVFPTAADEALPAVLAAVMAVTGCDGLAGRRYPGLSGGEQQRVQLARCLAQLWRDGAPQGWLFLDEPTSALDLYYQQHLLRLLKRLTAGGQLHVCVVLHDLNLAALWADRILLLHQGNLVAQGTPQEVIQQPVIHRWYGADVRLVQHPDNAVPQVYLAP